MCFQINYCNEKSVFLCGAICPLWTFHIGIRIFDMSIMAFSYWLYVHYGLFILASVLVLFRIFFTANVSPALLLAATR